MTPRADRPGLLDEPLGIDGVVLPPGRLFFADPSFASAEPVDGPLGWITDEPVRRPWNLWSELRERFGSSGLWSVIVEAHSFGDELRPWLTGELDPIEVGAVDALRPEEVFSAWWSEVAPAEDDEFDSTAQLEPYGRAFPGLASYRAPASVGPVKLRRKKRHVALVPATRAADVPALVGWTGPVNHTDAARISAALRSWEDRFGAELVEMGFDTLTLAVGTPPRTMDDALPIAAEQFAFCPDAVWQGTETLRLLAKTIVGASMWTFWWD